MSMTAREVVEFRRGIDEQELLIKALPEVAKHMSQALELVLGAASDHQRRECVVAEMGNAMQRALGCAALGKPVSLEAELAELTETFARTVDRARNPPHPAPERKPLRKTTAIYALRPIAYRDAAELNITGRTVAAAAIALVPDEVAMAAVAAGAAQTLSAPQGRRLRFTDSYAIDPDAEGESRRVYQRGRECVVAEPIASEALRAGAAEEIDTILPGELAELRKRHPEFNPPFNLQAAVQSPIDLGQFNMPIDVVKPQVAVKPRRASTAAAGGPQP